MLVTVDEAIEHLRLDPLGEDETNPDLELKIGAASLAIIKYLGEGADFIDDEGEYAPEDVPEDIKAACLLLTGYLYRLRDEDRDNEFARGYLPRPVMSLLYPYRIPTLG